MMRNILKTSFIAICVVLSTSTLYSQTVKVLRLDKDLYNYINTPTKDLEKKIIDNHLNLVTALSQTINSKQGATPLEALQNYFSHPLLKSIYTDVIHKYDNLSTYESELASMLAIAKLELKTSTTPHFAVHVSGFKENSIYIHNTISLSLDKYMGKEYAPYRGYFKAYQLQQMQPQMIVRDFAKAWLMADYIKTESTQGDLLSEIIEQGKLLYTLSVLLPKYTELDLLGYTDSNYNWCINNEKKIWESIVKKNHLYSTDKHIVFSYFEEKPNSTGFKAESPGQLGSWVGLQIVKKYANEKKQSVVDLIKTDYKTILKESKYRP